MNILLTGGAGYIGSHTAIELLAKGYKVTIIDNFSNSNQSTINKIRAISKKELALYSGDVRDEKLLQKIFTEQSIAAVMHFAGLKSVGESVAQPLTYYQNNIDSTLVLCKLMKLNNVSKLIFSSSATVYGVPKQLPIEETHPVGTGITNPYGRTKYMIEEILQDLVTSDDTWAITALRYFNAIGAHDSGLIGEDPKGKPNNLMPYIAQVAVGKLDMLNVFGGDYNTPDGTGIRDYIHVVDLAKGHITALEHLDGKKGFSAYNLGTGSGISVLELISAFEKNSGKKIAYTVVARRPGDVASCYADVTLASKKLGWRAEKTLDEACSDVWRWQTNLANEQHSGSS